MDDIASSKEEADAQLRLLREKRGFNGDKLQNSADVLDLHNALNIISDQLYQKSTHFLLELVQNADDNAYAIGVVPSLHLSLYKADNQTYLRSDCNEVGFTFKQLNALTSIGKSTKKFISGSKGYIGEKGIGFKSVFKVSDVVHIASGFVEFKLDRNGTTGMLLPIPSRFPEAARRAHHTQFLLELTSEDVRSEVLEELKDIKPQLLMFLKKLGKLQVSYLDASNIYERKTNLHDNHFGGETVTISRSSIHGDVLRSHKFVVHRRDIETIHSDSRRQGITSTEIVVAFEVQDQNTPITNTQEVFAFLPVDNFGFRFLIHADFILVASREGLDYSCQWNLALRHGIKDTFVEAIARLAKLPDSGDERGLCYCWPRYLSRHLGPQAFWNMLHQEIIAALKNCQILQSRQNTGRLRKPCDLSYVPQAYRFDGGSLFDLPSINESHLSFAYDSVRKDLSQIGVSQLNIERLYNEFCQWIDEVGTTGLDAQPDEWHRKVSSVFCNQFHLREKLRRLPIIPLRDGSWVNARTDHVYFASEDEAEHVPDGVNISIVNRDVSQDTARREFLEFLGIEEYNPRQVCALILELHQKPYSDLKYRDEEDFIVDMAYLFKHKSELQDPKTLGIGFLVVKGGQRILKRPSAMGKMNSIYLIDPTIKPNTIIKYRNRAGNPFTVFSDLYEAEICQPGEVTKAKEFRDWLLGFKHPRFASVPVLTYNDQLSPEWLFLYERDVLDLLRVIKHYWRSGPLEKVVQNAAAELRVPCLDGVSRRLNTLAVPTEELVRKCPHLDFARLPVPTLEEWGFLSVFGVLTTCNTTARLRELRELSKLDINEADGNVIHEIYQALNTEANPNDENEIRTAFNQDPLVFVTKPRSQWISHASCVWTAPTPLKQVVRLRTAYHDCGRLFCIVLGVNPAGISHIVDELCSPLGEDALKTQRFEMLFSLLGKFHCGTSKLDDEQIQRIRRASIFPIKERWNDTKDEGEVSLRSTSDSKWYIPDRALLERYFRGKVDMLSLPVTVIRRWSSLLKDLGLEVRFLSSNVEETPEIIGRCIRNIRQEEYLKKRLRFIEQLRAGDSAAIGGSIALQVWSVPSIKIVRRLDLVEVSDDDRLITIKESEDVTNIYLRESTPESGQSDITSELIEYFITELDIDRKDTIIVSHLINAREDLLPEILERYDIPLPEDTEHEEGSDSSESSDSEHEDMDMVYEDLGRGISRLNVAVAPDASFGGWSGNPTTRSLTRDDGAKQRLSRFDAGERLHGTPSFQELIPSHQSRVEAITRRAHDFVISDSLLAKSTTGHGQSSDAFHQQPPDKTEDSHRFNGDTSPRRHQNSVAASRKRLSQGLSSDISLTGYKNVSVENVRHRETGLLGETFVYHVFLPRINDWSFENWTSKLRVEAEHPRFAELEKDYADFTYLDRQGHMAAALHQAGVELNPNWSRDTTFHLEVKATSGPCKEPFFVSQNQLNKMRQFDGDANNAYLLLRVFNMEEGKRPNIKFFKDLWSLYIDCTLDFRSEQGYTVHERE